ncbi:MAG: hypothetical protein MUC83_08715, partial [Pirellula sp.]|nr:hypothetical protein [Pirellula sp.]
VGESEESFGDSGFPHALLANPDRVGPRPLTPASMLIIYNSHHESWPDLSSSSLPTFFVLVIESPTQSITSASTVLRTEQEHEKSAHSTFAKHPISIKTISPHADGLDSGGSPIMGNSNLLH